MTNELSIAKANALAKSEQKIEQGGSYNTNIANLSGATFNVIQHTKLNSFPSPLKVNEEYYNLIVVGSSDFASINIVIPATLALTKCISPELKRTHATLLPTALEYIKSYPSIVMSVNDKNQPAKQSTILGYIIDVKKSAGNIYISFNPKYEISQDKINSLSKELGLSSTPEINELDIIHWTIKKINMMDVLVKAGVRFPRM